MTTRLAEYQDFEDRYGTTFMTRLTDHDNTGSPDTSKVEFAADDATAMIYGKLGMQYLVPTDPHPQLLVRICIVNAIWNMGLSSNGGLGEDWDTANKEALNLLESIAAGNTTLGVEDPQHTEPPNPVIVNASATVFADEKLSRY